MQIQRVRVPELTRDQIETWSAIQQADPDFASPFFRPEFSKLVSGVHPNVEVAVLENGPGCVGFWPYQRDAFNVARSVGLRLCDFDGVVAKRGVEWCPVDLLEHCGLTAWPFGHLVGSQAPLQRFHWSQSNAPVIDLKSGFQDYCRQKWKAGSRSIDKTLRKLRKLGREVGPVRFVANSADRRVFDTVIQWKRDQCRRTRSVDYLGLPWTRELLSRIAGFRSDDFSGMLSAVYAGDQLVAAHLGMRSRRVLHGWFPVYNREFEKYSPGMVFWVLLAERAADLGIQRIDLGEGHERYKQSLKTGEIGLANGAVDRHKAVGAIRKGWWRTERLIRHSQLAPPLRYLVHSVRAVRTRHTKSLNACVK